jgi:hypothetical protein
MGTADQYRARADFCRRVARKTMGEKARATWLKLAADAMALAKDPTQISSTSAEAKYGPRQDLPWRGSWRRASHTAWRPLR